MKFSVVSLFLIYVVIVVGINGHESRFKNKNENYGIASRQKTSHNAHHGTQSRISNNHGHHQGSNRNKPHHMSTHQRSRNPRRYCEWVCPGDEVKWSYQRYINASGNTRNWTASGEFSVPDQSSGVHVSENSGINSETDESNQTGNGQGQGTQKNDEHGSKGKGQENQNNGGQGLGQGTQTNDEHGSQGTQNKDENGSGQGTQTNDEQGSRGTGQGTQNNSGNGSGQGTQNNGGQGSGEEIQTNDEHRSQEKGQGTENNDGKAQGSQTSGEEHSATDESNLNGNRQKQGQGQSKGQETQTNEENHSGTDGSNLSGNGQGQRQDQGQWGGVFNNSNEASGLNGGGIFSFFGHLLHGFVNGSEQIADIISNITHRGNGQGGIHNHSDDTSGQYTGGIFSFFGHLLQGFVNGSRNMMGHEHQFGEKIADIIANITHGGNGQGGGIYHSNDTSGQNGDDVFSFFGHLLQGFVNGSRDMMGHDNQIAEQIANGVGSLFGGENGRGGNGGENLQIDNGNIVGTGDGRGGDSANSGGGVGDLGGNGVGTGGSGIVNIGHDGSGLRTNSENEPILGGLLGLSRGRHHDRERHQEKVNSKSSHQKTQTRNGREKINQQSRSSKVKHEYNY